MLRANSKYRFWVILACLLALCLSPAATGSQGKGSWDNSGTAPKTALFNSLTASASSVLLAGGKRTRLHSIDNLLAVIHSQVHIVFKRESSPFLSDVSAEVTHCADYSTFSIRAPPVRHS